MYYRARYYAQGLGRFVSADSIIPGAADGSGGGAATLGVDSSSRLTTLTTDFHEFIGQVTKENQAVLQYGPFFQWSEKVRKDNPVPSGPLNPQALNRYSYVLNNPLRYVDPTGHLNIVVLEFNITFANNTSWMAFVGEVSQRSNELAGRATGFGFVATVTAVLAKALLTKVGGPAAATPNKLLAAYAAFVSCMAGACDNFNMTTAMTNMDNSTKNKENFTVKISITFVNGRPQDFVMTGFGDKIIGQQVPCLSQCGAYYMSEALMEYIQNNSGFTIWGVSLTELYNRDERTFRYGP
jgi:hypothetical protein